MRKAGRVLSVTWSLVIALAVAAPMGAAPAQGNEKQLDRARARIDELFRLRVGLLIGDLELALALDEGALESAQSSLSEAVTSFLEDNPAKLAAPGPFGMNPLPIDHPPFAELLESEVWNARLETELTAEQREALAARSAARQERLRTSLENLVRARLQRGLCLHDSELEALSETFATISQRVLRDDLVADFDPYGWNNKPDEVFALIDKVGAEEAFSPSRWSIVKRIQRESRNALHDYLLEVEYLLAERDDASALRKLLHGCAEAVLTRSGDTPRQSNNPLVPAIDPSRDDFWINAITAILELPEGEELPEFPSRGDEPLRIAWSEYILEILDQRAFFNEDQRESLLPLIRAYVDYKCERIQGAPAGDVRLPNDFGLSQDGLLVPADNQFIRRDTKLKSIIDTLHESCSEAQREVLNA